MVTQLAEIIHSRANAGKTNMGLTSWSGKQPRQTDAEIAKNYLSEEELKVLNLIVSLYLDFAELQALSQNPILLFLPFDPKKLNHSLYAEVAKGRYLIAKTAQCMHK